MAAAGADLDITGSAPANEWPAPPEVCRFDGYSSSHKHGGHWDLWLALLRECQSWCGFRCWDLDKGQVCPGPGSSTTF
eukprot:scaffold69228_cov12-Tisochrysis_lutea.AAC.1